MKLRLIALSGGILALATCSTQLGFQNKAHGAQFDRTNLPIAEPMPEKVTKVLPSEVPLPCLLYTSDAADE